MASPIAVVSMTLLAPALLPAASELMAVGAGSIDATSG
jgi:hypothetical protein